MRALLSTETPKRAARRWVSSLAMPRVARAWHLLSLDAPTVAATWCIAFFQAARVSLRGASAWGPAVFLGLATWLCYVGDRVLDARAAAEGLRARHRLYGALWRDRRRALLGTCALAALACVVIALCGLSLPLLARYVTLTTAALLYFAWVHWGAERSARVLAKEAAVATIFALGCVLPAWSAARAALRPDLLAPGVLFGGLCWLNCVAIERWEGRDEVAAHAHASTRWAAQHLAALLFAGATAAGALGLLERGASGVNLLLPCLAAAFVLLAAIERLRRRISVEALRILADMALLTPLSWWLLAGVLR